MPLPESLVAPVQLAAHTPQTPSPSPGDYGEKAQGHRVTHTHGQCLGNAAHGWHGPEIGAQINALRGGE